ncbi:MAG: hypothetical protein AUK54_09470 [Helicobacteraceae bacterium CG2_30_36_10]|nr:MAG: hypothetical protein AUK54_09470 [Helicobacteraceae bacterium CG2_30_36_10]
MKKILAFLAIVVVAIALLPMLGNKLAQNELDNRIEVLVSYGVEVSNSTIQESYLNTKKHYEFLVKDTEKFMKYLSQFSDAQLPPYVHAMVDGILVGVDVTYSNFPINDGVYVDIYPLSLSKKMMQDLEKNDLNFYRYIKNLLQNKGVLYHINYNVVNNSFNGYIKDIKEAYVLEDNSKVRVELLNASYEGNGILMAPQRLATKIDSIKLSVINANEEVNVVLKEFSSSSNFESQSTYASGAKLKEIEFSVKGTGTEDAVIKTNDLHINISSNTQADKAEYNMKTSFKELNIIAKASALQATDFNCDIFLTNVDKQSMQNLRVLLSEAKGSVSPELEEKIQKSVVNIISKGLTLTIADLSLAEIALQNAQKVKGFSLKAKLDLKEDADVAQKIQNAPLMLIQNINLDAKFKFSKALFALINEQAPVSVFANAYAKEEGKELVFDINFTQGELRVNGKALQ